LEINHANNIRLRKDILLSERKYVGNPESIFDVEKGSLALLIFQQAIQVHSGDHFLIISMIYAARRLHDSQELISQMSCKNNWGDYQRNCVQWICQASSASDSHFFELVKYTSDARWSDMDRLEFSATFALLR
jgi:hypothetical protein